MVKFVEYTKISTSYPIVEDASYLIDGGFTEQNIRKLETNRLFRCSPWLEEAYTLLEASDPVGRIGNYKAVYQLGVAADGYTPDTGAKPSAGDIGKNEVVKTITFLTYVDRAIVSEEMLHEFLSSLCELHPWEHPVIEVDGQFLVPF